MRDWIFLAVAFTALLAAMSPGPDYVLVTRSALFHSRRAGYLTALGVTAGLAVHACLFFQNFFEKIFIFSNFNLGV